MTKCKKIWSIMLALVMMLGVVAPSLTFAAGDAALTSKEKNAKTQSVTLHKLMLSKEDLKNWDSKQIEKGKNSTKGYDATQDKNQLEKIYKAVYGNDKSLKEVKDVYFALKFAKDYSDTAKAGKYVKAATDNKKKPATPLAATDNVDEAVGGLTEATGIRFETTDLAGKFEIHEIKEKSTYKGTNGESIVDQKAVPVELTLPLVNNDGTVLNAHVYPKNTESKPQIDKNFQKSNNLIKVTDEQSNIKSGAVYDNYTKQKAKATATVGTKIPYEVKTKINAGESYEKLVWTDIMTNGLTFGKNVNLSIQKVSMNAGQEQKEDIVGEFTLRTQYKLDADDRGFTLKMEKSGLEIIDKYTKGKNDQKKQYDVEITLTYTATLNGSAIVDNPEKNNVSLSYGHKPASEKKTTTVKSKTKELTVTKSFDTTPAVDDNAKNKLVLAYSLKENNKDIASVSLRKSDKTGTTFDLGNGITFEVTGEFSGKFKGLDDSKNYTFEERVAGYDPTLTADTTKGTVTVKNKKDNENPEPLVPTVPEVVTGGRKFVKTNDAETPERLFDAKFAIKRQDNKYLTYKTDAQKTKDQTALEAAKKAYEDAIKAYNTKIKEAGVTETSVSITIGNSAVTGKTEIMKKIAELRIAYEKAFKTAGTFYEWKALTAGQTLDKITNLVVLSSDNEGRFSIEGLGYGTYKLEEMKAPEGFAKCADVEFTVSVGSYAGTKAQDIKFNVSDTDEGQGNPAGGYGQKVINKKVTIPQTGGIGTLIFAVVGITLMAGAFVAIRRRNAEEN